MFVPALYLALTALLLVCSYLLARRIRGLAQLLRRNSEAQGSRFVLLRSMLDGRFSDVMRALRDSEAARGRAASTANAKLNALVLQDRRLHEGLQGLARSVSSSEAARARAASSANAKLNALVLQDRRLHEGLQSLAKDVSNSEAARARAALSDNAKLNSILEGSRTGEESSREISRHLADLLEGMKSQQVVLERVVEALTALEIRVDVQHGATLPSEDKHKARVLKELGLART
ncbi:hypothetical protein SAMN05216555_11251 [Arthrobacter cupressi]|uniref:Uncharacterized protein n=1 Tax=Arthrobacter cupressi TaxID=1045773 RepID=A0A1G8UMP2_9MICC|nr:hypothetical protein [Arthrobacter cupressi]SDJ55092.1 hypothetical protein SAMN05216555_11251 [Arthrobacter cupressi]